MTRVRQDLLATLLPLLQISKYYESGSSFLRNCLSVSASPFAVEEEGVEYRFGPLDLVYGYGTDFMLSLSFGKPSHKQNWEDVASCKLFEKTPVVCKAVNLRRRAETLVAKALPLPSQGGTETGVVGGRSLQEYANPAPPSSLAILAKAKRDHVNEGLTLMLARTADKLVLREKE